MTGCSCPLRLRRRMKRKIAVPATARRPKVAPTPMPALAPVLRPDGAGSGEETAGELLPVDVIIAAEVAAEVEGFEVVEVVAALYTPSVGMVYPARA